MKKILLVDDDPVTHHLVQQSVPDGYQLVSAFNLLAAKKLLSDPADWALALIDRVLPDGDGLSLCAQIRASKNLNQLPLIFISAQDKEADKVTGLFAGADDYITKPFGLLELKARILARLRNSPKTLNVGRLVIEIESFKARIESENTTQDLDLTKLEFKMLVFFAKSLEQVHSRETLLNQIWGDDSHMADRVVDTHVSHLRKKLAGSGLHLQSLRGEGYRMTLSSDDDQ